MMKKATKIVMAFMAIVLLNSCQKFTDIKKNSSLLYVTTIEDCQKVLDEYTNMNTGYPTDAITSADEYYLGSGEAESVDPEEYALYAWKSNAIRQFASPQYQKPYFVVYSANLVLEKLGELESEGGAQSTINAVRAAALFYKAYNYWLLAQMYAPAYDPSTADHDLGIVLRTSPDINDINPRSTVKQTYETILQHLKDAVAGLPAVASVASRPSKAAAYAMLARVYLSMGDYTNAGLNANAALEIKSDLLNYDTEVADKGSSIPFSRFHKEVLFHSVTGQSSLILWSYYAKINPVLSASYADDDLRKTIFLLDNGDGSYSFKGNYEPGDFISLFTGLATDEVYLMRAECYARAGELGKALDDLNTLLSKRWKTGTYVNLSTANPATDTQAEVLNKILEERGKELLMRGLRWTDLRRLNKEPALKKDLVRYVDNGGVMEEVGRLPANDKRYTLLIPNEVITTTRMTQNPR